MARVAAPVAASTTMGAATLSLALQRQAEDIHEPEFAAYVPLVSFDAFLVAQRMSGWVRLDADRLTDLLNAHDLVHLMNVLVEDHRDRSTVVADETLIPRSEIIAVIASGPRGDPARRVETRSHAVVVETGVYRIGGRVHATPGVSPEQRMRDEGPMVPLTEAWLEYRTGERIRCSAGETLIVNRELATRIDVIEEPSVLTTRPLEHASP